MTNSCQTGPLLNQYEFLERLAVSCMGKKHIQNKGVTLPRDLQITAKCVEAYSDLQNLFINYLKVDLSDKQTLLSLFKEHAKILRYLRAQDLYFDINKCVNGTYFTNVTIPLFVHKLSPEQSQMKEGFIKHVYKMLQASFSDYPNGLKDYAKRVLTAKAQELGLKLKPIEWVGKIRVTSYPTISTFESSLLSWSESQSVYKSTTPQIIELANTIYLAGLFVKSLRELNNGFPSYQCVMDKQTKLINSENIEQNCLNIMKAELQNNKPATFLSTKIKACGKVKAHKKLLNHNDGLFIPYYFQQQLKNQLNTNKKVERLNHIFSKLKTKDCEKEKYLKVLDIKDYMIRALFSATSNIFEKFSKKFYEENEVSEQYLIKFYEESKSKFQGVESKIKTEIATGKIEGSTERVIINLMSLIIKEFHNNSNAGIVCRELAIFLYCFRINEQSTQPNTNKLPERIFWERNIEEYNEKKNSFKPIAEYNSYIHENLDSSWKVSLLCNPFKRLEDSLREHFDSSQQDLKKSINAAFKKKRAIIVGELNKTPYDSLLSIKKDIVLMKLEPYTAQLLPNVMKYISLSNHEKESILNVLRV